MMQPSSSIKGCITFTNVLGNRIQIGNHLICLLKDTCTGRHNLFKFSSDLFNSILEADLTLGQADN